MSTDTANTAVSTKATNRRAVLGAVLAAGALAAVPSRGAAANLGVKSELQVLIDTWNEAHRRLKETYNASCTAGERVDRLPNTSQHSLQLKPTSNSGATRSQARSTERDVTGLELEGPTGTVR